MSLHVKRLLLWLGFNQNWFLSAHTIKLPQHQIVGKFIQWFLSSQTSVTAIGALLHLSTMNMPKDRQFKSSSDYAHGVHGRMKC
jgi:hypothetical protein